MEYICDKCGNPFQDEDEVTIFICEECIGIAISQIFEDLGQPIIIDEDTNEIYYPKGKLN
jgi:hypothetical protein